MEPEARYTLVGAIVLALIAALAAGYVWLAHAGGAGGFHYYMIHFEHQTLDGLQMGSDVNMRGVKVGRVQEYSISRDNINRVDVTIRVEDQTPVSVNTRAVIARNFVTGLARVDLVTPGTPGPELREVMSGERYPVIAEGTSGLDQIAGALNRLAVTGEGALRNLEELLDATNRKKLIGTISAVQDLASNLDQRLEHIDEAIASFSSSALAVQRSSQEGAIAVQQISRQTVETLRGIQPLVAETQKALASVSRAASAVEKQTATATQRFDVAVDAGTIELRATARELRRSAEQVSRAAERLSDPRAALLGPSPSQLGPGEGAR